MNKLELKHIVGYLPYGLKVYTKYYDAIVEPTSISKRYYLLDELHYSEEGGDFDMLSLNNNGDTKPILRPISDLHKEIEGVVHIVEMARMATPNMVHVDEVMSQEWKDGFWKVDGRDKDEMLVTFGFGNREFWLSEKGNMVLIDNLELYEYLYQHHFDIHGLIEQNLAININTL